VVECRPARGGPLPALRLRLRNWEGAVRLEAPRLVSRRGQARPHEHAWALEPRPGARGPCRLTLRGSVALEDVAGGVPMPEVSVAGAARQEQVVALAGEVSAEGAEGLVRLAELPAWAR